MKPNIYFYSATIKMGFWSGIKEVVGTFKTGHSGLLVIDELKSEIQKHYPDKNIEITSMGLI